MRDFTRREFLKMSGVGVGALALAACGGGSSSSAPAGGNAGGGSAGGDASSASSDVLGGGVQAEEGTKFVVLDKLVEGTRFLFPSLTPFRNTSAQRQRFIRYMYDRLIYPNTSGGYEPQGAKSWTVGEDGVTWTVELYDYITDSAGNPVTADDIIWFYKTSLERATKPCFQKVKEMRKVSDYVFEMEMKQDMAEMPEVTLESIFLISQASFEASKDEMVTDLISAAAYVVTDFVPDSEITFTLRDDYWQKPELISPLLATNVRVINQKYITEASQMQIAMETSTVDCYPMMNATVIANFENNDDYVVVKGLSNNNMILLFSGSQDRLIGRDLNLRQAICACVDPQLLIQGALNGYGQVAYDINPPICRGYQPKWENEEYFPYDIEKAKAYLAASDYHGEELVLAGSATSQKEFTIIQACCQAIGINVKLELMDMALWTSYSYDGRTWDMCTWSGGNGEVNMWTQTFDGTVYEYGDKTARRDMEFTEWMYDVCKNANYTPENIDKVHRHLTDNAYAYGMYTSFVCSVMAKRTGIVETVVNSTGELDPAACKYAE